MESKGNLQEQRPGADEDADGASRVSTSSVKSADEIGWQMDGPEGRCSVIRKAMRKECVVLKSSRPDGLKPDGKVAKSEVADEWREQSKGEDGWMGGDEGTVVVVW